jgi:DNA polymerase
MGRRLHGNLVQGVARDVFMHQCVEIEKAGIPVVMHVHDEVVCLVPEDSAQEKLEQIISIMSKEPDWAPDLPLSAEGSLSKVYKK